MQEAEKKYVDLFHQIEDLCREQGWGEFSIQARSKEIYAVCMLNHKIADTFSGADAFNESGEAVEYKSTSGNKVKGSYTGISVQPTWKEQVRYLREEKILIYPEHYFNRFEDGRLVESWVLTGKQVYDILLPKLKKKYPNVGKLKDPRLAADVSTGEIVSQGKRVI